MNRLLKNPSHVAQIGYNGFNMEQIVDFTSSTGMLLPIYFDILNPGDKVKCNAFAKIRTQPLSAPAEFEARVRLDWFAVPIEQIYKYFGDMYYNIQDIDSSFVQSGAIKNCYFPARFPYFSWRADNSGYNLFYNLFLDMYQDYHEDDNLKPFGFTGEEGVVQRLNGYLRIMDCLGMPVSDMFHETDNPPAVSFTPLLACAYQKIYFDYYRLTDREANDPHAYNLDKYFVQGTNMLTTNADIELFRLRYIPYKKDFFTNKFTSPIQGAQSIGSANRNVQQFNSWLSNSVFNTGAPDSQGDFGLISDAVKPSSVFASSPADGDDTQSFTPYGDFNSANIHALFAMEKALEITRRSAKHYDAQTLAHWGVEVPKGIAGEVIYLGSQTQPFVVGDVVSTAATEYEELGTLAGKGYSAPNADGSINKPITFEANCHTILMCVYSVQPTNRYTQRGLDKLNCYIQWSDFLHPEFDNLGMQPLFPYQLSIYGQWQNEDYDWQYSFSELKIKANRVFGNVHNDGTLSDWVPQIDAKNEAMPSTRLESFWCRPDFLNGSLAYEYGLNWLFESYDGGGQTNYRFKENYYALLYERDPLINSVAFECVKSSKMSKYGLMNL